MKKLILKCRIGSPGLMPITSEQTKRFAEWLLKGVGKVAEVVNDAAASALSTPTGTATTAATTPVTNSGSNAKVAKEAKKLTKEFIEENGVMLSPSSWVVGKGNPWQGALTIATWDPRLLLGAFAVDALTLAKGKPALKATGNAAVDVAARAGNKTAKAKAVSRRLGENVLKNFDISSIEDSMNRLVKIIEDTYEKDRLTKLHAFKTGENEVFNYLGSDRHILQIMKSGVDRKKATEIAQEMHDNAMATAGKFGRLEPGTFGEHWDGFQKRHAPFPSLYSKFVLDPQYTVSPDLIPDLIRRNIHHELGGHGATLGYNPESLTGAASRIYEGLINEWSPHYKEIYEHNKSLKPERKPEYRGIDDEYISYLENPDEYSARARSENIEKGNDSFNTLYKYFTEESVNKLRDNVWFGQIQPTPIIDRPAPVADPLQTRLTRLQNKKKEGIIPETDLTLIIRDGLSAAEIELSIVDAYMRLGIEEDVARSAARTTVINNGKGVHTPVIGDDGNLIGGVSYVDKVQALEELRRSGVSKPTEADVRTIAGHEAGHQVEVPGMDKEVYTLLGQVLDNEGIVAANPNWTVWDWINKIEKYLSEGRLDNGISNILERLYNMDYKTARKFVANANRFSAGTGVVYLLNNLINKNE